MEIQLLLRRAKGYIKRELEPEGTTTVADLEFWGFRFTQITVITCVVALCQTVGGGSTLAFVRQNTSMQRLRSSRLSAQTQKIFRT